MRLSDAAEELREAAGISVHRSHWVALPAVRAHRREKGRDLLLMSDGAEVPVSRSNRTRAQEAGLF
jgi:DNA-binding LytR/AlgR family response regulator